MNDIEIIKKFAEINNVPIMLEDGLSFLLEYIKANNNKNGNDANGFGFYAYSTGSAIDVKNMNVEANSNGLYGILASYGGTFNFLGNGNNLLQANNNKNITEKKIVLEMKGFSGKIKQTVGKR